MGLVIRTPMRAMGLPTDGDAVAAVLWRPARRRERFEIRGLLGHRKYDPRKRSGIRARPWQQSLRFGSRFRCCRLGSCLLFRRTIRCPVWFGVNDLLEQ